MLTPQRKQLYEELEARVKNTPLVELNLDLPNGNRIFVKEEYKNPTQSHYDRVYVHLLKELEKEGKIVPCRTPLLETTSGSAGESFAWACRELGYEATIVLPETAPPKKVEAMKGYGAKLIFTPAKDYVLGAATELRRMLTEVNRERKAQGLPKYWGPNHSRDDRTLDALEPIGIESLHQMQDNGESIDYFIVAGGNGSSVLGPGRYLKRESPKIRIIVWEPIESGAATELRTAGLYKHTFGIQPGMLRHNIPGTGAMHGLSFPFMERAIRTDSDERVVDDIYMVASADTEDKVKQFLDPHNALALGSAFGEGSGNQMRAAMSILNVRKFPKWETYLPLIQQADCPGGKTTAASVGTAINMMKQEPLKLKRKFPFLYLDRIENSNFVVIGYDLASKY